MGLMLKAVPARQGMAWVRLGLREFFRHPWTYGGLFVAFMGMASVVSVLGALGEVLLLTAIPLLSLAYMMATAASLSGHAPGLGVLLAPWRLLGAAKKKSLLTVCLAYAFANIAALQLCDLIDRGALEALMTAVMSGENQPEKLQALAEAPGVTAGALARLGVTTLLSLPFWFAPALVVWSDQGVGQALFSSALALWRNKAAMLVYGLGWFGAMALVATLLAVVSSLLGVNSASGIILLPMALMLTCAFYVSLFFMFRDSFGAPPDAAASEAPSA